MPRSRFRAWKFVHPDFDVSGATPGIGLDMRGGVAMVDDVESVKQSIQLLLTTPLGDRVMRPDYGCQLHELAFEPNNDTTAGLAIHYVRQAIARWEPRVDILNLDANRDDADSSRLNIELDYRVRPHLVNQQLRLPINLTSPEI